MNTQLSQTCFICKVEFLHNRDGRLTKHLSERHNTNFEEYVILTEYNGVAPLCECGFCSEKPTFYRGKFRHYAAGHDTFEKRIELYVLKYGNPKCLTCGNVTSFRRGKPKKYCSFVCQGKQNGFSKPTTQNRIRKNIIEKYGVSNVAYLPEVQEAISKANIGRKVIVSDETKKKHSNNSKAMWANPDMRIKMSESIKKAANDPKERKRRSVLQQIRMNDPEYVEKLFGTCWGKFSKLHQRIRMQLQLEQYGFLYEQIIGNRMVDELHFERRIVIEINGDYIHANPKKYKADDVIRIPGENYTAQEKWERDRRKIEYLSQKGYQVFVIWESDNIEEWKQILQKCFEKIK